jgi:hypothetical protein
LVKPISITAPLMAAAAVSCSRNPRNLFAQFLSSCTLRLLCQEASAHVPTPLGRLEHGRADLLFERQLATAPSVPLWCQENEIPF